MTNTLVTVISRKDANFRMIIGHTYRVIKETEDGNGYYISLPFGACRVEKDEVEIVRR